VSSLEAPKIHIPDVLVDKPTTPPVSPFAVMAGLPLGAPPAASAAPAWPAAQQFQPSATDMEVALSLPLVDGVDWNSVEDLTPLESFPDSDDFAQ
jgi:hypothetical protein